MEGLNNSNAATVNANTSSSTTASNSALLAFNLPLDSFASAPTPAQRSMNPGVLAICLTNESSGAANCYVYSTSPLDDADHPPPTYNSGIGGTEGFGDEFDIQTRVDATLTITSNDDKMNTWFGFKSGGALYLRGDGWDDMDIRESIVAALELAEEQLECTSVYLCLEKSNPHITQLTHALLYATFQLVTPGVLPHADPKYLVMGIDF
ncbi:hypothetical protein BGZ91_007148 [Linnemannia elongata]|uniref:Ornithine decarboxylase antizyme n=1 Tax=Linnemannia elongata AG-77 TaxID=1314771 RepID=A0A197KEX0_9FUNG|nr:hypothetical protein BGZ91_007148 [Linnemannia elongata]OAQ36272.1 hypothetical protein K457DRAFT_151157 [Linnemannia elongata AG-77]